MNNYVILTDSGCDIKAQTLAEWGVDYKALTYRFNGEDASAADGELPISEFYARMRVGGVAKTAAINTEEFSLIFSEHLESGCDIFYLGFSSGLSNTYNAARIAAEQCKEKFPDRKIVTFDSLCASAGQGLLLHLLCEKKAQGASIEQLEEYAREIVLHVCHFFTVDDLVYLKRGGRVSPTVAFVGGLLGIKPVLHVDDAGHLISLAKVRGRRAAIAALADKYTELALNREGGTVFISHGDCEKDAQSLAQILKERHGVDVKLITDVGAVIGSHSGPGTLALFFIGSHR